MSSTDQAFIRAYGHSVRTPSAAAKPPRAPVSSIDDIDGAMAHSTSAWSEPAADQAESDQQIWTLHASSIDVGLESVVPAPHFARRAAAFAVESNLAEPRHSLESARSPQSPAGIRPVRTPHLSFGNSPKAPLSSFADRDPETIESAAPKPVFEIDSVRWPAICKSLLADHGDSFSKLADDLRYEAAAGRKVLAITGIGRGEGRTTLALCLTKQLAAASIRVAVVDADFTSPSVANRLGINVSDGWETAIAGEQSVWETMIESTTDRLSIVPLCEAHFADEMPRPVYGIAAVLAELAEHYDIVLVDAGPLCAGEAADWLLDSAAGVQGVIVAHDMRRNQASQLATACLQLAEAGVLQLGIAEMFGAQN